LIWIHLDSSGLIWIHLDSSGFIWIHEGYISPHPNKNGAVIKNMEIGQTVVIQQSLDHDGLIIGS